MSAAIKLLHASSEPMAIGFGPELWAVHNAPFRALTGFASASAEPGTYRLRDLCGPLWPRLEPLVEKASLEGESPVLEDQLFCSYRCGFAEEMYLRCACSPVVDDLGGHGGVLLTLTERTERVLSRRRSAALRHVASEAASARTIAEACRCALGALARHPSDVPFALVYLRNPLGSQLQLAATAGLPLDSRVAPQTISADGAHRSTWPVDEALKRNTIVAVNDVLTRFGTLPAGDWPFAPRAAVVAPITCPGRDEPDGVLVTGLSARHELDASYTDFIELLVKEIAAAIAGGRAREEEARHNAARASAQVARARRRARLAALKARFTGILDERTRLAREIHDTLLQGVTGISLQLHAVLPHVRTSPDGAARTLERIIELAEKTGKDARQAVWDIRPATLVDADLARFLEQTAQRLIGGAGVTLETNVSGAVRPLTSRRQSAVLRIVQEAVANAIRHADAHRISLHVTYKARRLRVAVRDDGRGFTVARDFRSYAGHWGLLGMEERSHGVGGTLRVRSIVGRGAIVIVSVPYRAGISRRARASRTARTRAEV